ncbi:hypothetical protein KI387_037601, partial [Taxus chinensis]
VKEVWNCERLPVEMCAFAVSSTGSRCVLEKKYSFEADTHEASLQYQCQSSGVNVGEDEGMDRERGVCAGMWFTEDVCGHVN